MPLFESDKLTVKQAGKLARWESWGNKKAFLHQIHKENDQKRKGKVKAEQWLERIGV